MTKIEFANEMINPIVGCSKISDGCKNCYAEKMAWRMAHNPKLSKETREAYKSVVSNGKWNGKIAFVPSVFDKLKTLKKPRRIFVGSMCDVFHKSVRDMTYRNMFRTLKTYPQHIFIFLTKRSDRITDGLQFIDKPLSPQMGGSMDFCVPDNIWLGASVESQKYISRIDDLLKIPAKVRFISVEPMLSEIIIPEDKLRQLQWVICGGETGTGARPMFPEWAESLKQQCYNIGVPFFFKKWGDSPDRKNVPNGRGGLNSDGRVDGIIDGVECRQFPKGETK